MAIIRLYYGRSGAEDLEESVPIKKKHGIGRIDDVPLYNKSLAYILFQFILLKKSFKNTIIMSSPKLHLFTLIWYAPL